MAWSYYIFTRPLTVTQIHELSRDIGWAQRIARDCGVNSDEVLQMEYAYRALIVENKDRLLPEEIKEADRLFQEQSWKGIGFDATSLQREGKCHRLLPQFRSIQSRIMPKNR